MTSFYWAGLAALIWGFVPLLEKLGLAKASALAGLFYRSLGVLLGLVLLLPFMVKPSEIKSVGAKPMVLLILAGFMASILGQICFYNALKSGDISRIVPISGSYPFLTFLIGIIILGEAWTPVKFVGVILIVAGIWILKIG
jgi:transporter family protein